jgi:hypothetical protein
MKKLNNNNPSDLKIFNTKEKENLRQLLLRILKEKIKSLKYIV